MKFSISNQPCRIICSANRNNRLNRLKVEFDIQKQECTHLTGSNRLDVGSLSLVFSNDLKGTLLPNKFFWLEFDKLRSEINHTIKIKFLCHLLPLYRGSGH